MLLFNPCLRKYTTTATRKCAIKYSNEVQQALAQRSAIVALESTIISHGMPYPQNLDTAVSVENVVRSHGATPATVALMDGHLYIGLEAEQLERLAKDGLSATKCSRRDLAHVLANKDLGATTVSGTMIAAELAGIDVFVTGGIGGVHRGVEETMDISADLSELGRTPVVVVCAGVKSILDVPRTLEFLETQGVAVMCWQTNAFPAFFTVDSGEKAPLRVDTAEQVSNWINANKALNLQSGAIVAVPNPAPADEEMIHRALTTALQEVKEFNVQGKKATPYLLKRINELTGGDSLKSNIALVKNNAHVGASIAVANAKSRGRRRRGTTTATSTRTFATSAGSGSARTFATTPATSGAPLPVLRPLVVGGATVDMTAQGNGAVQIGTSNVGTMQHSHGGVGRNITECLGRFNLSPTFVSVTGNDDVGRSIVSHLKEIHVDVEHIVQIDGRRTAVYTAVLDGDGDLIAAVADMEILDEDLNAHVVASYNNSVVEQFQHSIVVVDGNVSAQALLAMAEQKAGPSIWFEPTSVEKSTRCLPILDALSLMSPNVDELMEIARHLGVASGSAEECAVVDVQQMGDSVVSRMRRDGPAWVLVTMGDRGVVVCSNVDGEESTHLKPEVVVTEMVNCTGAGDCLLATVAALRLQGMVDMEKAVGIGMKAASLTIQSEMAVSTQLDREWLDTHF